MHQVVADDGGAESLTGSKLVPATRNISTVCLMCIGSGAFMTTSLLSAYNQNYQILSGDNGLTLCSPHSHPANPTVSGISLELDFRWY